MFSLNEDKLMRPIINGVLLKRRQDLKPIYRLNGDIYVANLEWLKKNKNLVNDFSTGYIMTNEESLDIDIEEDFNK